MQPRELGTTWPSQPVNAGQCGLDGGVDGLGDPMRQTFPEFVALLDFSGYE
jgi:hypothetical protein